MQDNVTQAANVERELRLDAKAFRENSIWNQDGDEIRLTKTADRLDVAADFIASTTAQSEAVQGLVEALERYADGMCEGWCEGKDPKACRRIGSDNCAGCPAVIALAAHRESQP